jgi:hypothetical protein
LNNATGAPDGAIVAKLIAAAEPLPVGEAPSGEGERGKPQSARVVELADDAVLYKTPEGEPFADLHQDGHRETHALRERGFRDWLAHRFYQVEGRTPSANAMQDALSVLTGRAMFEGATREVFVRVGHTDDAIYLDLGRPGWEAVEVNTLGWQVVQDPPVRFRRPRGLLPLPVPAEGGDLAELWQVANVHGDERALVLAWLVMLLHRRGPYPILVLRGEQGTGKTTTAKVLKSLLDPNRAALRPEPRELRDLMIAANNARLLGFDNLSSVAPWLSDAMCRLSTGGGFAVREHYADAAETLFEATRPMLINGIADVATRSDLIDRCIFVETKNFGEGGRRTEAEVLEAWDAMHPRILGAILNAAATALACQDGVKLGTLPRMADFAVWATAAEPALGLADGAVLDAFTRNRSDAHHIILDASPVGAALQRFAARQARWEGTPETLRKNLLDVADEASRSAFPKNAKGLSDTLRRIAPNLRAVGVNVCRRETRGNTRVWIVERLGTGNLSTVATAAREDAPGLDSSPVASPSHAVAGPPLAVARASEPSQAVEGADSCDGPVSKAGQAVSASPSQPSHGSTPSPQDADDAPF